MAEAEAAIRHLTSARSEVGPVGTTLQAPVRIVDAQGRVVIELSGDGDGGYLHLCDTEGHFRVTLGAGPDGGWVDVIQAGEERLAVTLIADEDGGRIELTRKEGCYFVDGVRYYPAEGETV